MDGCMYSEEENRYFLSKEYLKRFIDPQRDAMGVHSQYLDRWHYFYTHYGDKWDHGSGRLLEFGGGPTLHSLVTACRYFGGITFADYAESNRHEIQMWKDKEDEAHDWTKYVSYVVSTLEESTDPNAVQAREDRMRRAITEIVKGDIRSQELLVGASVTKFDVVQTNLCLEIASNDLAEFKTSIKKLRTMIKPNGYLVTLTAKQGAWYSCTTGCGLKLHQLFLDEDSIHAAIEEAGLTIVETFAIEPAQNPVSATKAFQFVISQNIA